VKKTILLSVFVCLSFVTVLGQQLPPPETVPESATWIKWAPANAGFTVLLPGKPSETVGMVEGRPGVENHLITLETKLAGYVVSYVQFPDDVTDPDAIKLMLDSGREGGIASSGGKIKSENEIKLNDFLGREWIVEIPVGLLATARAYWVKRRLYQTIFVTTPTASDPPELIKRRQEAADKFLDSFTLSGDNAAKVKLQ
jgi:hypothetical protein